MKSCLLRQPTGATKATQAAREIVIKVSSMVKKGRRADEFLSQREKDPEYLRRRQEQEARTQQYLNEMYQAEIPLIDALREAGVRVKTVWDLANTRAQYPDALPILFQHLQRPYPDSVLTGIASALAVPESKKWWKPLLELFQANQEEKVNGVKTALAAALAAAADDDVVGDVIRLVEDSRHGQHRVILLSVLGRSARPEASEALARAAEDPQLVKEARLQLRRLARRRSM